MPANAASPDLAESPAPRPVLRARRLLHRPAAPVDRAVITHGHSDHARPGHRRSSRQRTPLPSSAPAWATGVIRQALGWHQPISLGDVRVWLEVRRPRPGQCPGGNGVSRLPRGRQRPDYKRTADPTCARFEPVPCDVFVTEATFALPVFVHPAPAPRDPACLLRTVSPCSRSNACRGLLRAGQVPAAHRLLRQAGWDGRSGAWRPGLERDVYRATAASNLAICARRRRGKSPNWPARSCSRRPARSPIAGPPPGGPGRRTRLRLDAGPPAGQVARRGTAAGDLRSCRLE